MLCTPRMFVRLLLVLFAVVMTQFYFKPRWPEAATCVTLNQSVVEAPWTPGMGCAFHTNQERRCSTCVGWPYRCCQPDTLVDDKMCWQAHLDIQVQHRPKSFVTNLALVCNVDVINCMLHYRRMVTANMTFDCYYTSNDASPRIGSNDTETNMTAMWIFVGCFLGISFIGSCKPLDDQALDDAELQNSDEIASQYDPDLDNVVLT